MNSLQKRPVVLVILDGWGADVGKMSPKPHTPCFDELQRKYPTTELHAAGNAEIGHSLIGAGRVIGSDASRVREAVENESIFENDILKTAIERSATGKGDLHLVGLLSDAGIHASLETLYALLRMAKRAGIQEAFVHGILDGRDVPQRTADVYVDAVEIKMADIGIGRLATLCGRHFAMDSDENWERTARAYTMLVLAEGERVADAATAIRNSFLRGITDEFIPPIVIENEPDVPVATVKSGDVVIFFNHRGDTMRQLVGSLAVSRGADAKPDIDAVCLTEYDSSFGLPAAFPPLSVKGSIASALEENQIPNVRITDAGRAAHITNFFNCGEHVELTFEKREILPAAAASSREVEPEMMSFRIADKFIRAVEADSDGVFIVNLPVVDVVSEIQNSQRTREAIEYVDTCLGGIVDKVAELGGVALITSSHYVGETNGSAGEDGSAFSGKLPFIFVDDAVRSRSLRKDGSLADVGPTLLAAAGVETPREMTGRDLRID